jgi:L-alanine-DL-glutamate epimerase-like enolase superfamily enzyme
LNLNRNIALDANASFTKEDCLFIQETSGFQKLMYIEQPLEIGNFGILKNGNSVNWMADEDCQDITFLEKLKPYYSSINIKLMKCGGLTPALEMITEAKKLGYKIMLGCMTESSIGISAGCAIAGLLDFADLDGANLISNDYATGSFVDNGKIILSEKPGLGIALL